MDTNTSPYVVIVFVFLAFHSWKRVPQKEKFFF